MLRWSVVDRGKVRRSVVDRGEKTEVDDRPLVGYGVCGRLWEGVGDLW